MPEGKRRHRPALIVLVVVAAIACLGLAWWQWSRFESSSGSGQNLGYALQWPAFGVMFVYAYRRFVVLESDPDEVAKLSPRAHGATEVPADLLPPRPATAARVTADDDSPPEIRDLAEYNRYLSELASSESGPAQQENP
ncbi:transcriptional regulator [Williamsia maris]|uniref:DNA-binding transcriptional regulator of glucitol operon n=1 Tax=Williamsia maris TaxID=72806 RepID=A0ABT1HL97_9NOCA|nr:transcriptional regulator [Williamsia maris]MCP2178715.1 DNA-binding transcriptional regulator of glucitol operon [Williamsia maris]